MFLLLDDVFLLTRYPETVKHKNLKEISDKDIIDSFNSKEIADGYLGVHIQNELIQIISRRRGVVVARRARSQKPRVRASAGAVLQKRHWSLWVECIIQR